jgi:hypothetical protein
VAMLIENNTCEAQWRTKFKKNDSIKPYKYLGVEANHNIEHENEKERAR